MLNHRTPEFLSKPFVKAAKINMLYRDLDGNFLTFCRLDHSPKDPNSKFIFDEIRRKFEGSEIGYKVSDGELENYARILADMRKNDSADYAFWYL